MNPESNDELLSAYLDGELTVDEELRVTQLMAAHPEYRQMFEELRALRHSFETLPRYRVPNDLSQQVLRRAEHLLLDGDPGAGLRVSAGATDDHQADDEQLEPASLRERFWALAPLWRALVWPAVVVSVALAVMILRPGSRVQNEKLVAQKSAQRPEHGQSKRDAAATVGDLETNRGEVPSAATKGEPARADEQNALGAAVAKLPHAGVQKDQSGDERSINAAGGKPVLADGALAKKLGADQSALAEDAQGDGAAGPVDAKRALANPSAAQPKRLMLRSDKTITTEQSQSAGNRKASSLVEGEKLGRERQLSPGPAAAPALAAPALAKPASAAAPQPAAIAGSAFGKLKTSQSDVAVDRESDGKPTNPSFLEPSLAAAAGKAVARQEVRAWQAPTQQAPESDAFYVRVELSQDAAREGSLTQLLRRHSLIAEAAEGALPGLKAGVAEARPGGLAATARGRREPVTEGASSDSADRPFVPPVSAPSVEPAGTLSDTVEKSSSTESKEQSAAEPAPIGERLAESQGVLAGHGQGVPQAKSAPIGGGNDDETIVLTINATAEQFVATLRDLQRHPEEYNVEEVVLCELPADSLAADSIRAAPPDMDVFRRQASVDTQKVDAQKNGVLDQRQLADRAKALGEVNTNTRQERSNGDELPRDNSASERSSSDKAGDASAGAEQADQPAEPGARGAVGIDLEADAIPRGGVAKSSAASDAPAAQSKAAKRVSRWRKNQQFGKPAEQLRATESPPANAPGQPAAAAAPNDPSANSNGLPVGDVRDLAAPSALGLGAAAGEEANAPPGAGEPSVVGQQDELTKAVEAPNRRASVANSVGGRTVTLIFRLRPAGESTAHSPPAGTTAPNASPATAPTAIPPAGNSER